MTMIYSSLCELDLERKKEIISRIKDTNDYYILKYIQRNHYHDGLYYNIDMKLNKCVSIYKLLFKDDLNITEQTFLFLYIIFPDDERFIEILQTYKYNYEYVGHLYGVSEKFVFNRYKCYRELKKYDKSFIKELKKINY